MARNTDSAGGGEQDADHKVVGHGRGSALAACRAARRAGHGTEGSSGRRELRHIVLVLALASVCSGMCVGMGRLSSVDVALGFEDIAGRIIGEKQGRDAHVKEQETIS